MTRILKTVLIVLALVTIVFASQVMAAEYLQQGLYKGSSLGSKACYLTVVKFSRYEPGLGLNIGYYEFTVRGEGLEGIIQARKPFETSEGDVSLSLRDGEINAYNGWTNEVLSRSINLKIKTGVEDLPYAFSINRIIKFAGNVKAEKLFSCEYLELVR